jgi:hypothetical protein
MGLKDEICTRRTRGDQPRPKPDAGSARPGTDRAQARSFARPCVAHRRQRDRPTPNLWTCAWGALQKAGAPVNPSPIGSRATTLAIALA